MKLFLSIFLLSTAMAAQSFMAPSSSALADAPSQRPFWTVENRVSVSILAGLVAADAFTTQRGLNQGVAEIPMVVGVLCFACGSRRHSMS